MLNYFIKYYFINQNVISYYFKYYVEILLHDLKVLDQIIQSVPFFTKN